MENVENITKKKILSTKKSLNSVQMSEKILYVKKSSFWASAEKNGKNLRMFKKLEKKIMPKSAEKKSYLISRRIFKEKKWEFRKFGEKKNENAKVKKKVLLGNVEKSERKTWRMTYKFWKLISYDGNLKCLENPIYGWNKICGKVQKPKKLGEKNQNPVQVPKNSKLR